ncbi:HAMP domain-containing protein [Clostridia bacterium OttesenSCG-928-O13]|nr:HAMP domain-containing protein [Clostridia bacterium OttesenSCG-928-O13]
MKKTASKKKTSITKRWVRGSLLFTLAVVLLAEGVFLWFTIRGYYSDARQAITNEFSLQRGRLGSSSATIDEKSLRLVQVVEQFESKNKFELMLVRANGTIDTTSSGIDPGYAEVPQDISEALRPGSSGVGEFVGKNESGEKVMAVTMLITPYSARSVVAMRLVTSLTLVDKAIVNIVIASVALLCAIILASVISGVFFIRSIVFPLHKVEATASLIAQGDLETRIANDSNDEIGSLCTTINNMADELSKSERMKNEFISSVSHELRTPLTSIKGWTETVGQLSDPENPNFKRGLEIIAGETDRLYDMVEELLDFSRMQDGLKLDKELLDLAAEVEDAVLLSGQRAAGLGVALLYSVPELPVAVMADKNRVRQVLVNILDNAIKYSFTGGEVNVEILQDENSAYVVVADEGQGISPEDLENVKQKFYKGKGALRGSGIGLAVVDEIMVGHGGDLQIASEAQRGTTVTLRFPLFSKKGPDEKKKAED